MGGYYGLPYGGVYSPYTTYGGYHYLGKRDAEAKSDAWGYYGLPYGGVEIKISTRENYSNSARENSGPPVKIFKKVGVKVKFPPVKKNQKTAKNGFHGHF